MHNDSFYVKDLNFVGVGYAATFFRLLWLLPFIVCFYLIRNCCYRESTIQSHYLPLIGPLSSL